jgi:hypothetical protein
VHVLEQYAEIIGALELGVLPAGNIEEMFKTLPPEEAHLAKRKFRKIKRTRLKQMGSLLENAQVSKAWSRKIVRDHCMEIGKKILNM